MWMVVKRLQSEDNLDAEGVPKRSSQAIRGSIKHESTKRKRGLVVAHCRPRDRDEHQVPLRLKYGKRSRSIQYKMRPNDRPPIRSRRRMYHPPALQHTPSRNQPYLELNLDLTSYRRCSTAAITSDLSPGTQTPKIFCPPDSQGEYVRQPLS